MKTSKSARRTTGTETSASAVNQAKIAPVAVKTVEHYGIRQMLGEVVFRALFPAAHTVQVAGDFNDWRPAPMQKVSANGVWQLKLRLNPGTYRYRLVVDGTWQQDPYNEDVESNPYGGLNSVLRVSSF